MEKRFLSTLTFDNYLVTELSYKQNSNFSFENDLDVSFDANAKIQLSDSDASVTLKVICGDENNIDCPFVLNVEVMGIFKVEGNIKDFKELVTTNTLAILFPYVRSLVSDLSSRSNVYPQYRLPLLNIVEFIKSKNNKIQVK